MKKLFFISLSLLLVIGMVAAGCAEPAPAPAPAPPAPAPAPPAPEPAPAKPIELTVAYHVPPVHQQHKDVIVPWAEELAKRTEGRVTAKLLPAGALGQVFEEYDMVLQGTCDVSWLISTYYPGRHPLEEIFHLPFAIPPGAGNPTGKRIRDAVYEKYLIPHHYNDMKVLWTGRFEPNVLHLAEKPVRTMADMEGLVIGFPGGKLMPKIIAAMGASPEQVTVEDMYTAMERGMIDGEIIPLEAQLSFGLIEVTKYVTLLNLGAGSNFMGMRFEAWNKIPPADQKIIDELSIWAADLQGKAWTAATEATMGACRGAGIEFIELSPQEMELLKEMTKPVELEWVDELEADGLPAAALYDEVIKMAAK